MWFAKQTPASSETNSTGEWKCPKCPMVNSVDAMECAVCATHFRPGVRTPDTSDEKAKKRWLAQNGAHLVDVNVRCEDFAGTERDATIIKFEGDKWAQPHVLLNFPPVESDSEGEEWLAIESPRITFDWNHIRTVASNSHKRKPSRVSAVKKKSRGASKKDIKAQKQQKQQRHEAEVAPGVYIVERIVDRRKVKNKVEYLIKWSGYSSDENTWEPEDNVQDTSLIEKFMKDTNRDFEDDVSCAIYFAKEDETVYMIAKAHNISVPRVLEQNRHYKHLTAHAPLEAKTCIHVPLQNSRPQSHGGGSAGNQGHKRASSVRTAAPMLYGSLNTKQTKQKQPKKLKKPKQDTHFKEQSRAKPPRSEEDVALNMPPAKKRRQQQEPNPHSFSAMLASIPKTAPRSRKDSATSYSPLHGRNTQAYTAPVDDGSKHVRWEVPERLVRYA